MLSAVVLVSDSRRRVSASSEAMVRTLASLVPAAVQGLIRDVTLAAIASSADAQEISDHAGCALAQAADHDDVVRAGLALARGPLIFVVRAGRAPEAGFIEEVLDIFDRAETRTPNAAILRAAPETLLTRMFAAANPIEGLIVRRQDIRSDVRGLADLRRGLNAPVELRCRLRLVA